MKRSDLFLEIARYGMIGHNPLVDVMHKKIEAVYSVLFQLEELEGDDPATRGFKQLGELIRKALEN